jgi:hypothetical protein
LVVALLTAPGLAEDIADVVADSVQAALAVRHPSIAPEVVCRTEPLVGSVAGARVDLVQVTREIMLKEDWQLAVCLTDLPLQVGRRTVTAHVSVALGVGVVSVPALGAVDLPNRVTQAVMRSLDHLLSRSARDKRRRPVGRARLRERVRKVGELTSPVGHAYVHGEDNVRFVTAPGPGDLRLLLGMVRANRPWRLIAGLSRALVGALGAAAFGLTSPAMWQISDSMDWARMILLAIGSVLAIGGTLIVAHRLWESSPSPAVRERVTIINVATALTVLLGVLTLYLALLMILNVCALTLISFHVLEGQLHHLVTVGTYFRIAWVVTSLAMIGGALGAALESDLAVREAAYGYRPSEQQDGTPPQSSQQTG